MTLGVDTSEHQKGLIDWEKFYQAGASYGFQRASASLRRDRWYARDNLFASEVGIDCGAYHYLYPEYDGGSSGGHILRLCVGSAEGPCGGCRA